MTREEAITRVQNRIERIDAGSPSYQNDQDLEAMSVALDALEEQDEWTEWPTCPKCGVALREIDDNVWQCRTPYCNERFTVEAKYRIKEES